MDKLNLCVNGASWCVIASAFIGWLPYWAALASLIVSIIQLWKLWKGHRNGK